MKRRIVMLSVLAILLSGVVMAGLASAGQVIYLENGQSGEVRVNEPATFVCNVSGGTYVWDFGDGSVERTNLSTVTHVYAEEGDYSVTVTVNGTTISYTLNAISTSTDGAMLALLGAGLAVGVAGMGTGIGSGIAGSAAAGATASHPEKFGKYFVFQTLPQTQAIYGLLVAILILIGTGSLSGGGAVPLGAGLVAVGAGLAVGIAGLSAIGQGVAAAGAIGAYSEKDEVFGKGIVFSALPETQAIYGLLVAIMLMVFSGLLGDPNAMMKFSGVDGVRMGLTAIGAGLAVGIAGLSAIGQGIAAGSGIGTTAQKPEMFGKSIVFSALPETQAIYGLLIAILLMVFSGIIGEKHLGLSGLTLGVAAVGAGVGVGIAGLSAIGQGITAASGISATARKPESFGRSMIFSVMSETPAIFALLIAILIMIGTGIMG